MIMTDGSHIVEVPDDRKQKMFLFKFNITLSGDVAFFAEDKEVVEKYIKKCLKHVEMPLPFKGQDGSMKATVNKVEVKEAWENDN